MTVKCLDAKEYYLTENKEYEVIQVSDNEKLLLVVNDEGIKIWYPAFIFNY